jgi:cytochrome oxidase Cu insertion factor (SCO1/SenC/PrrC family)
LQLGEKRNGRGKLLLVLAFFALPVIAATLAFKYWEPSSFSNYGELIALRELPDFALATMDGEQFRASDLRGKWTLLMVDSGACSEFCHEKLYTMRQLRLTQGKNKDRVVRVWLISDAAAPAATIKDEYAGTFFVSAKGSELLSLLPAKETIADHIFLVDPKGNLMMRYPKHADASRMVKDLSRLLRLSGG